ncbi:MAG: 30S ribosomal protein S5 [Patescibacteria group bacterium]
MTDVYKPHAEEYKERVIQIKRVSKKTKGGNKIGFTALVLVGNGAGKIGVALGKAPDVSSAIQKGISKAKVDMTEVNLYGETIPHEITHKHKSAMIKLRPAPEGSGIIAGGAVRHVIELVGISNVSAKVLGSTNKINNVRCTIEALSKMKHPMEKKNKNSEK